MTLRGWGDVHAGGKSCAEPFTARVYMVVNRKSGLLANGRELYTATHIRSTLFIYDVAYTAVGEEKAESLFT